MVTHMAHISLRVTEQLGQQIKDLAESEHRSLNAEVIVLVEEALAARTTRSNNRKLVNV